MPAHDGRAEPGARRAQAAAESVQDLPRIRRRLFSRPDGIRRDLARNLRHLEHAPSYRCGVRLDFDSERLPPRVTALIRARRQQLSTKIAELASKRGLVLFEGRPM